MKKLLSLLACRPDAGRPDGRLRHHRDRTTSNPPADDGGEVSAPPADDTAPDVELTATQQIIAEAETMTLEELAAKAIEESNGQTFFGVGNSSRGKTALPALHRVPAEHRPELHPRV